MCMGLFLQNFGRVLRDRKRGVQNGVWNDVFPVAANAFGAIRQRRREEAICIQLHNRYRCSRAKISVLTRFFDVRNAFYCVDHAEFNRLFADWDVKSEEHMATIVHNNIVAIYASDELFLFLLGRVLLLDYLWLPIFSILRMGNSWPNIMLPLRGKLACCMSGVFRSKSM